MVIIIYVYSVFYCGSILGIPIHTTLAIQIEFILMNGEQPIQIVKILNYYVHQCRDIGRIILKMRWISFSNGQKCILFANGYVPTPYTFVVTQSYTVFE